MPSASDDRKQILFVDDDPAFLSAVQQLFSEMSRGRWEITVAESHAQALVFLTSRQMDVVVLDIGMPVMDGVQFLRLLGRTHPGQQVVMLTGLATEANRKACMDAGAALFLEKPASSSGFQAVFAALDALASAAAPAGFRGVMRRVGLNEVLQMECLGTKSSVLEIFTGKVRGRIFICDGAIVHAESGKLQGELALYGLLALRGAEFNLMVYTEPPRRTISGQWEFLLMEAARLTDEGAVIGEAQAEPSAESAESQLAADSGETQPAPAPKHRPAPLVALPADYVHIEEVLLCSGSGELLYEWECKSVDRRMRLLSQVEQQAAQLATLAPVGQFDRLEILTKEDRVICQVRPDRRLFVRSSGSKGGA